MLLRMSAMHLGVPLSGRALRCDEDISTAIPHANTSHVVADVTVFVRRGQGTLLRALTVTDEDSRNQPKDFRAIAGQFGWLRR